MQAFMSTIDKIDAFLWGIPLLVLLVGTGIFMTIRLTGLQFRKFGYAMQQTIGKVFSKEKVEAVDGALTPFQAMCTALAGSVGTGNVAGVASAIALGGPGAVFWMWISALVGMCTKYCEVTLAVHYREVNPNGEYIGGPMYYIKNGMGKNWAWLGGIFAFLAGFASFGIGNMTQINTIATSVGSIFTAFDPAVGEGKLKIIYIVVGIVFAGLTALVLFGGLQRIGGVTEKLVPSMAIVYILTALAVIVMNYKNIGPTFAHIFECAFNPDAVGGGLVGTGVMTCMRYGVGRGVFSNEAGLGSAPMAHASANTDHPAKQGMFGIFEVFADTIVICTMTALAILMSGCAEAFYGKAAGTDLTILSFGSVFGDKVAAIIIAACITMFAFSTILSWSLYGARCFEYLGGLKAVAVYKIAYIAVVVFGAAISLQAAWTIADILNALMALPNLIAVLVLSPQIVKLTKDLFSDEPKLGIKN